MTMTDFLIIISFVLSELLCLIAARSIINSALKKHLSCRFFLDNTTTSENDIYENEGFFLIAELTNTSFVPFPYLTLNINLPDGLVFEKSGSGTIADVFSLSQKESSKKRYWVRAVRRGSYSIDHGVIVRKNILGLNPLSLRLSVPVNRQNSLTVYPTVMNLTDHFTTAPYTQGEVDVPRSPMVDPMEFNGIRPYSNDPMNQINWKKTAALDELMVNEWGFTEARELTILLNIQSRAYERFDSITKGVSNVDRTELAISAAASVVDSAMEYETPLQIIMNGESDCFNETEPMGAYTISRSFPADSLADYHSMMRMLARISGGVSIPAHLMIYTISAKPKDYLNGKNLIVISPFFDSTMREFYLSMQSMGYEVVFYITSGFTDTEEIPEDLPLYYRTHRQIT